MKKNNVLYPLLGLRIHLNRCLPMKLMILLIFVFSIPAFSAAYSPEGKKWIFKTYFPFLRKI